MGVRCYAFVALPLAVVCYFIASTPLGGRAHHLADGTGRGVGQGRVLRGDRGADGRAAGARRSRLVRADAGQPADGVARRDLLRDLPDPPDRDGSRDGGGAALGRSTPASMRARCSSSTLAMTVPLAWLLHRFTRVRSWTRGSACWGHHHRDDELLEHLPLVVVVGAREDQQRRQHPHQPAGLAVDDVGVVGCPSEITKAAAIALITSDCSAISAPIGASPAANHDCRAGLLRTRSSEVRNAGDESLARVVESGESPDHLSVHRVGLAVHVGGVQRLAVLEVPVQRGPRTACRLRRFRACRRTRPTAWRTVLPRRRGCARPPPRCVCDASQLLPAITSP